VQKLRRVDYAPMWINELRQASGRVRLRGNDDASVVTVCRRQPAEDRFESALLGIVEAPLVTDGSSG